MADDTPGKASPDESVIDKLMDRWSQERHRSMTLKEAEELARQEPTTISFDLLRGVPVDPTVRESSALEQEIVALTDRLQQRRHKAAMELSRLEATLLPVLVPEEDTAVVAPPERQINMAAAPTPVWRLLDRLACEIEDLAILERRVADLIARARI